MSYFWKYSFFASGSCESQDFLKNNEIFRNRISQLLHSDIVVVICSHQTRYYFNNWCPQWCCQNCRNLLNCQTIGNCRSLRNCRNHSPRLKELILIVFCKWVKTVISPCPDLAYSCSWVRDIIQDFPWSQVSCQAKWQRRWKTSFWEVCPKVFLLKMLTLDWYQIVLHSIFYWQLGDSSFLLKIWAFGVKGNLYQSNQGICVAVIDDVKIISNQEQNQISSKYYSQGKSP